MKHIPSELKMSIQYSFSILTTVSTVVGLWGYTVRDINGKLSWWHGLLILVLSFFALSVFALLILRAFQHRSFFTKINGKYVTVKIGDIFEAEGWKLIPCNERFDVKVDDKVIAHNTLNGIMIDRYVSELSKLEAVIVEAQNDNSQVKGKKVSGRIIYPLGRIIPYGDFLMLSFSHFDSQNKAYVGTGEYEMLLFRMWAEIRRVYAAKPIVIPLIGAGITNIEGMPEKDYTQLLRCILCTLRRSRFQPEKGITIVLTAEAMNKIDMNVIREEF